MPPSPLQTLGLKGLIQIIYQQMGGYKSAVQNSGKQYDVILEFLGGRGGGGELKLMLTQFSCAGAGTELGNFKSARILSHPMCDIGYFH